MVSTVSNLKFIDSFQFMNRSLAKLAENLPKDKFHHVANEFGNNIDLVTLECIYPYDYIDSFACFAETELPPIINSILNYMM